MLWCINLILFKEKFIENEELWVDLKEKHTQRKHGSSNMIKHATVSKIQY